MKNTLRSMVLVAALLASAQVFAQNTGSFTLETTANGDGTLTPKLSWSTTPVAQGCVASGNAAWDGAKAGSGEQTLSPVPTTQPQAYALLCSWPGDTQAMLTWVAPTQNTDGSALTNLAGFRVNYGQASTQLTQTVQVANPAATGTTIGNLTSSTWFFGVRAYTTQGAESALSNIVSKVINAETIEWSQQTGIKVPAAPTAGTVE